MVTSIYGSLNCPVGRPMICQQGPAHGCLFILGRRMELDPLSPLCCHCNNTHVRSSRATATAARSLARFTKDFCGVWHADIVLMLAAWHNANMSYAIAMHNSTSHFYLHEMQDIGTGRYKLSPKNLPCVSKLAMYVVH